MFRQYLLATRPWSFPVSTMAVLVTAAGLFSMGYSVRWDLTIWAVVGIMLFHAAENVLSDYYDFRKGVDRQDTFGSRTLTDQHLTPRQVWRLGIVLMVVAVANGLVMAWVAGWQLLIYGGIGALLALIYPWMKYHALGDVDILLEYGIIPALGTSFMVTGHAEADALWMVPAFVTVTMGVLHANNTRDIAPDTRAEITTLPMLIGKRASIGLYIAMLVLPMVWIVLCAAMHRLPWLCMLLLVTAPLVMRNCRQMMRFSTDDQAINDLDEKTAQLQLLNCLILVITLVLSRLILCL